MGSVVLSLYLCRVSWPCRLNTARIQYGSLSVGSSVTDSNNCCRREADGTLVSLGNAIDERAWSTRSQENEAGPTKTMSHSEPDDHDRVIDLSGEPGDFVQQAASEDPSEGRARVEKVV